MSSSFVVSSSKTTTIASSHRCRRRRKRRRRPQRGGRAENERHLSRTRTFPKWNEEFEGPTVLKSLFSIQQIRSNKTPKDDTRKKTRREEREKGHIVHEVTQVLVSLCVKTRRPSQYLSVYYLSLRLPISPYLSPSPSPSPRRRPVIRTSRTPRETVSRLARRVHPRVRTCSRSLRRKKGLVTGRIGLE